MLTVDSRKRITIWEVMQHPWFLTNLPPELDNLNTRLLQTPPDMQTGICRQTEEEIIKICAEAVESHRRAARQLAY